jgi:hypothetical protein
MNNAITISYQDSLNFKNKFFNDYSAPIFLDKVFTKAKVLGNRFKNLIRNMDYVVILLLEK